MDAVSDHLDALADAIALVRAAGEHDHEAASAILAHGDTSEVAAHLASIAAQLLTVVTDCSDCASVVVRAWQHDVRSARLHAP